MEKDRDSIKKTLPNHYSDSEKEEIINSLMNLVEICLEIEMGKNE
jgi:hypothetical protein